MADQAPPSSLSSTPPSAAVLPVAIATPLFTGSHVNLHAELVAATIAETKHEHQQQNVAVATPIVAAAVSPLGSLAIEDVIDACDRHGQWYMARIVDIPTDDGRYHVQFEGKSTKHNEWITVDRMAPPGTKAFTDSIDDEDHDRSAPVVSSSSTTSSTTNPAQVHIYADQMAKIRSIISGELWKEIGGDLFGRWSNGVAIVQYVLGPGPRAKGGSVSFFQDEAFLETWGNALGAAGLEHIGEWHSHWQLGLPHPSGGDCSTVIGAMQDYDRPQFLLCIGTVARTTHQIDVNPFVFTRGSSRYARRTWHILPGTSPFAHFKLERATVKAEVKDYQWYATVEGKKTFQQIHSEMTKKFRDLTIKRDVATHDLDLCFTVRGASCVLRLPSSFPDRDAVLIVPDAHGELDSYAIMATPAFPFKSSPVASSPAVTVTDSPATATTSTASTSPSSLSTFNVIMFMKQLEATATSNASCIIL